MNVETIETDILVIGAGIAGSMAAIKAKESGVDVLIVTKGPFGRDGAASWMAGWGLQTMHYPPDSAEIHAKETIQTGQYLNNQNLVFNLVRVLPECVDRLEKWGVRYLKKDGKIVTKRIPGTKYLRVPVYEREGRAGGVDYRRVLPHKVRLCGIKTRSDVMITELLKMDNGVVGATGLDIQEGNIVVIKAKITILATGGCMGIYRFTTTSPTLVGDGYAMALRAGAALSGMEFADFYVTTACWPPLLRGEVDSVTDLRFDLSGKIYNKRGDEFLARQKGSAIAYPIVVQREIEELRGSPHDGVYLSFSHLPRNLVDAYLEACHGQRWIDLFKDAGIDLYEGAIEVAPAPLESMGGCKVNKVCETSLTNLFAAGEVAYGAEGAYTMAGNPMALHMASGFIAGQEAGERAKSIQRGEVDEKQIEELKARIIEPLNREAGIRFIDVERETEEVLRKYFPLSGKTKGLLENGIDKIVEIRREILPKIFSKVKFPRFNLEWVESLEASNRVDVIEMLLRAALMREESRGLHFRKDFPNPDPTWLKNVVIQKIDDGLKLWTEPVEFTYFRPEEVQK
jgi:succinate dehydrogenase/fumarate reductase flavoprotein subunit